MRVVAGCEFTIRNDEFQRVAVIKNNVVVAVYRIKGGVREIEHLMDVAKVGYDPQMFFVDTFAPMEDTIMHLVMQGYPIHKVYLSASLYKRSTGRSSFDGLTCSRRSSVLIKERLNEALKRQLLIIDCDLREGDTTAVALAWVMMVDRPVFGVSFR